LPESEISTFRQDAKTVLFNLFVIVEPLMYFRVCHGTPINKNLKSTNYLQGNQIFRYEALQQINSFTEVKERNFITQLFLHFWNVAATFRIWSSGKRTRV